VFDMTADPLKHVRSSHVVSSDGRSRRKPNDLGGPAAAAENLEAEAALVERAEQPVKAIERGPASDHLSGEMPPGQPPSATRQRTRSGAR